ncbi:MAG TPA: zf-HC2 domain-containing protein [Chloroflexia bacterium]|nr:zf-HC2 domain-containing protein [Chloroflexia bacterium]
MQRSSCEDSQLLISKYVDHEASHEERVRVDAHVAACSDCACKLTEYMEMAAIFSESPLRAPSPELRTTLFSEIYRLKDEERRTEQAAAQRQPRPLPLAVPQPRPAFTARLLRAANPFAAAGVAAFAFFTLMVFMVNGRAQEPVREPDAESVSVLIPYVPTVDIPIKVSADNTVFPPPVSTNLASPQSIPSVSATVRVSTALAGDAMLRLAHPTPIFEDSGSTTGASGWHVMRDPAYGYTLSYPPNWWTQVSGKTRYFFPWGPGGSRNAPYWVEMKVLDNPNHFTAEEAMAGLFGGACDCILLPGSAGRGSSLRRQTSDANNLYDEIYGFDPRHIYLLRLNVPLESVTGNRDKRWADGEAIFSRISGKVSLAAEPTRHEGYSPVLFLDGTDLMSVDATGKNRRRITQGYGVRVFSLSPDLRQVAFTTTNEGQAPWGKNVYLASLESGSYTSPRLLWTALVIHDIAWYSDRVLLAIANSRDAGGFGIYRLDLPGSLTADTIDGEQLVPRRLTALDESTMAGARGLSVSPDRQLITFMAPLGEDKGTDIYALRPDGTDLQLLVSHADPVSPSVRGHRVLPAESQAIKSYVWTNGALEAKGYRFNLLFTCGKSQSSTFFRGGFLYSAPGAASGALVSPERLGVQDAVDVQIVHIAHSPLGRVAFTGFYNLKDPWVETLAGLWTADVVDGALANLQALPMPTAPQGIADLQWSPDGKSLIYRETVPLGQASMVSRYDGRSPYRIIKLNPETGSAITLYETSDR